MTDMTYHATRRLFLDDRSDGSESAVDAPFTGDANPGAAVAPVRSFSSRASGGLSINLATGQDASGVIQTAGDLADANWKVTNANNYKQGPIAFTVAPGDADFYSQWATNGPASSWIAADPDNKNNGNVTYTFTFSLSGYNPDDATLQGGQFKLDDAGTVYLNGHALGSQGFNGWTTYTALSNGAGDFVAGVNTLVIQTTKADNQFEAARLEGAIVDDVLSNPPGPIHWANDISGSFTNGSDWVGGAAPESDNDAVLDAPGKKAYTVTSASAQTVNSIQTASAATLLITGGTFIALSGTGSGANAGAIQIGDGATMSVAGTVTNSGVIGLAGAGSGVATTLIVAQDTTLSGGGKLTLTDFTGNAIVAGATAAILTNMNNTIAGAGTIGSSALTLINEAGGVIDASGANALIFSTGANPITNAGLIEATGADGLVIRKAMVDGAGGVILVGDGSRVHLIDVTLAGGAIESEGTGVIHVRGANNLFDGVATEIDNGAKIHVGDNSTLMLEGAIHNTGAIDLRAGADGARLGVGLVGAGLSGGGLIVLGENGPNEIFGASSGATLSNIDNTILGVGALGAGSLTLVNEVGGVIVGESAPGLVIDTGANTVDNAGLIEADRNGSLTIISPLNNTGVLYAKGGTLILDGAVSGDGVVDIAKGVLEADAAFDEDVHIAGGSGALQLAHSQDYTGTISGFSTDGGSFLDLRDIAFVGSGEGSYANGVLTVTDGAHTARINLVGKYVNAVFTASDDGHGGTLIVATSGGLSASVGRFAAAAAAMGADRPVVNSQMTHGPRDSLTLLAVPM